MNQYIRVSVRAANGTVPLKNVPVRIKRNEGNDEHVSFVTDISGNIPVSVFKTGNDPEGAEYTVSAEAQGFEKICVSAVKCTDRIITLLIEPEPSGFGHGETKYVYEYQSDKYSAGTLKYGKNMRDTSASDLLNTVSYAFPSVPFAGNTSSLSDEEKECILKCFQKAAMLRQSGRKDKASDALLKEYSAGTVKMKESLFLIRNTVSGRYKIRKEKDVRMAAEAAGFFFPGFRKVLKYDTERSVHEMITEYFDPENKLKYMREIFRKIMNAVENSLPDHIFSGCGLLFSGNILKYGDSNDETALLQSYLKFLSAEIPELGDISINGRYDRKTADSVRAFQKKYGLFPDGRTNMFTWNGISDLYNFFHKSLAFYKIR